MNKRATLILCACLVLGIGGSAVDPVFAEGSGPFNMMNPSRWFGGNKNRDYDDYDYGPYGGPGPGYGPPGYPPPIIPPPGYGYGAPAAPQAYAPAQPPATVAPQQTDDASATRIKELEARIRQLEASRQIAPQSAVPSQQGTNNVPATQAPPSWQGGNNPPAPQAPSSWQGGNNPPAPQAPSSWQGGNNPPASQAPPPPAWQGTNDYSQPATQAPMPPAWQRGNGSQPQVTTKSPAKQPWQDGASSNPAPPAAEHQSDSSQQKHRFRPF